MISVRFYAELNDFLAKGPAERQIPADTLLSRSVTGLITYFGIPHEAVDLVLVNGEPAAFESALADGDRVSIYPVFERFEISSLTALREHALRIPAFAADVHLGKLARRLRMLGFDTSYDREASADSLVRTAASEKRIILSKNSALLRRRDVTHLCLLSSPDTEGQLREVIDLLDLQRQMKPLSRCLECNAAIHPVQLEEVMSKVPPRVQHERTSFMACPVCGRVYWQGTHYERMMKIALGL